MPSASKPGATISGPEVTNVSGNGIWLLWQNTEMFLPFQKFPWFAEASIRKVLNVTEPSPGHFFWPDMDVDLTVEMIQHPEKFPLKAKHK